MSATIVLLTNKMTAVFECSSTVTTADIIDSVEMIGFDCEFLTMTEVTNNAGNSKENKNTVNIIGFESDSE